MKLVTGIACLLAFGSAMAASQAPAPPTWTAARALAANAPDLSLYWPVLATWDDTAFVVANVFGEGGAVVAGAPAYFGRIPGTRLTLPEGSFQFAFPKIVIGPRGDVQMVWAEFDSVRPRIAAWDAPQTTLWHATFHGGRWTPAERILSRGKLEWTRDDGHLAIDKQGVLHAVTWVFDSNHVGLLYVRHDPTGWSVRKIPLAAMQPDAAVHASGDTIMVALSEFSADESDTTGVAVLRSTDGGKTWSVPRVLQRLKGRSIRHPQFFVHRGILRLAWAELPRGRFAADTLRVARLSGVEGVGATSVALPPGASDMSFAQAPCGDITALVGILSFAPRAFEIVVRRDGAATVRRLGREGALAAYPGIVTVSRRFVAVLVAELRAGEAARAAVMERPACAAP